MAWCRRATGWSHNLNQCWLRSLSSYGITRPKLKQLSYLLKIIDILLIISSLEKWNKGLEKVWKRSGIPCQPQGGNPACMKIPADNQVIFKCNMTHWNPLCDHWEIGFQKIRAPSWQQLIVVVILTTFWHLSLYMTTECNKYLKINKIN